ncbi:unnamed protein product [Caenorhabditis sp. 36 PRJEB53466]|nr:unnamed protein product [Caenorhabditis sp. 36 PRJEB53466]
MTRKPRTFYGCLFVHLILCILCTISTFHMLAIAIDKYVTICCRDRLFSSRTQSLFLKNGELCHFTVVVDYRYLVYVIFFSTILAPTAIIVLLYSSIYSRIRTEEKQVKCLLRQSERERRMQGRRKLIRILLILVVSYGICWYPLYIINTIDYFWPQFSINSLTLWTVIMSHMSCALNPLIYAYGMPGFKKALRAFFNIQTDNNTCANYSCYMRSTGNGKQRSISVRGMPYEHSLAAIRKISAPTPVMIDRHRSRRQRTKGIFKFIALLSCVLAFFTILIVYKCSSRLKIEYRNILLAQLTLALVGCFLISLISPSFLLPYPMFFLSGPFAIDYRFTLYLSFLVVMFYFFPTMLLLSFGLIYNFMSLKQLSTQLFNISVDRLMKMVIFTVTMILLTGNFFLMTQLSRGHDQIEMQTNIVENIDARCAEIFNNYAVFVFDIYSWPILVSSIEALFLCFASVSFCAVMTVLSCKHFESQKPTLSATAARNHRMMLYMLISYVAHFLLYFSFPLAAFTIAIHDPKPIFGSITYLLIICPAHFLGISLSVTYCLIITPYRKVIVAILMILTCSPLQRPSTSEEPNRSTNSLSIIDNALRRHSYRVGNQISNG